MTYVPNLKGYSESELNMAKLAKALSHPARIRIMELLEKSESELYCNDLVTQLPLSQASVSQHLRELKAEKLIIATVKPPKVGYTIHPQNWKMSKSFMVQFIKSVFNNTP